MPALLVAVRVEGLVRVCRGVPAEDLHQQVPGLGGGQCLVQPGAVVPGQPLEDRVRALFDAHELPLAVMLDSVGSAAVESLAEHVNDLLCQAAIAEEIRVTNRISPGYAGWDTAQQRELFRLCPGTSIGVALNEACFMMPVKTISFLVGIGPEASVDHYFTQCRRCWMADCAFRRAPAARTVHQ